MSEVLTYLPRCLLPPHHQVHSALPACRGRCCGNPHKGMSAVRQDGNGNDSWGWSSILLPLDDIADGGRCTPSRSVPSPYNTCIDSNVDARLGLLIPPSGLSQPLRVRFGEWWMRWELRPRTLVRVSYIFQGQSNSHRLWVRAV